MKRLNVFATLVVVFCFAATGCVTSVCSTHPGSLACSREEARTKAYKQCTVFLHKELHEEIMAGFYEASAVMDYCHTRARKMYK